MSDHTLAGSTSAARGRRLGAGLAVLAAAVLNGYALGRGSASPDRYLVASLLAAVPAIVLGLLLVDQRPKVALGTLAGLLAGAGGLALFSVQGGGPGPVVAGLIGVLTVVAITWRMSRLRPTEVVVAIGLAYLSLAWIYELSISLHNL